jgi:enoyl-CoA hydratase/carnithine racemase
MTPVLVERRGPALWITLNRPDALNALSPAAIEALDVALDQAEGEADLRAVVLAAEGRAFCAGADLSALADAGLDLTQFLTRVNAVFNRLESLEIPVIAAVQGTAVAGGLELVLCCDLVVATESARFGDAHANFGLLPGGGAAARLPRRVGASRAKHLMFTGAIVPAAALAGTDLLTAVVPDDQLQNAVDDLLKPIVTKSRLGIATMKRLIRDGLETTTAGALALECSAIRRHVNSDDFAEGLRAFAEKRAPVFSGR